MFALLTVALTALIACAVTFPVDVILPFTVALLIVADTALIDCAVTLPVVVRLPPTSAPFVTERFAVVVLPVTVNAFSVRFVMLDNVPAPSVPLNTPPVIVPGTVRLPIKPVTTLIACDVTLPVDVILPFTVALLIVALTALIDCAVTLPVVVRFPPTSAPFVTERFDVVVLPVTVNAFKVRFVMLDNVPAPNVPLNTPPVIVPGTVRLPIKPVTTLSP